jgi:hypothetical protein
MMTHSLVKKFCRSSGMDESLQLLLSAGERFPAVPEGCGATERGTRWK